MNIVAKCPNEIDDDIMEQLMYLQADAYAFYESLNSDEKTFIIAAIPSTTVKQFRRKMSKVLFLMKMKKTKGVDKVLGMACISKQRNYLCLHDVFVKQFSRNRGIGTALLKKAINIAKTKKMDIMLKVNPLNEIALNLYRNLGFTICKDQMIAMDIKVGK